MRLDFLEQAEAIHVGDNLLAGAEAVHAAVGLGCRVADAGVGIEDIHQLKAVTLAHGIVIEIVGRGDLHTAGAEGRIHVVVGNDGNVPVAQWQAHPLSDQVRKPGILRVHRNGRVAKHGLRARGRHRDMAAVVTERIAEMPQMPLLLLSDHLEIGNRSVQGGVPVHQALSAVNQSFTVQADEHVLYRGRQPIVHGEALARPVQG